MSDKKPFQTIHCTQPGCGYTAMANYHLCYHCDAAAKATGEVKPTKEFTMSQKYPKYYKSVEHLKEIDVYTVHELFNIQDPSGCIQHASKKLLLSGVRTGGKTAIDDIKEARDTLTRYLQLHNAAT